MKPDKYQQRCLKTWFDDKKPIKDHMLHVAMGLCSEAGEFASLVDKQAYKPSKKITREMMLDELGDIFYNVVIAAHLLGVTIDELDQMNAEKLKDGHGWVDDMNETHQYHANDILGLG
jgi:NTP pyrophosphatase (non-canonical NTP hydrolase)